MAQPNLRTTVQESLPELCVRAVAGSAWCALLVCISAEPSNFDELCRIIGIPASGKYRAIAFDAVSDAWAMYRDALDSGVGFA